MEAKPDRTSSRAWQVFLCVALVVCFGTVITFSGVPGGNASADSPTTVFFPFVANGRALLTPANLVSDPDHDQLFVVSQGDYSIVAYRESTLASSPTVLARITPGASPFGIGLFGNQVFVANSAAATVTIVETTTRTRVQDVSLASCGTDPAHLAVNPNNGRVYIALHGSGRVAVLDSATDTLVACIPVGMGVYGIAADAPSNSIFAGTRDSFELWRIDGDTNAASPVQNLGGSVYHVSVNPTAGRLFAMVGFFDAQHEPVPDQLYSFQIDAAGGLFGETHLQVGNTEDGGFVLQSDCTDKIYVAETADNTLRVLNGDLSPDRLLTPASGLIDYGPFALFRNGALGRVYVTSKAANSLRVLPDYDCTVTDFPKRRR